ncbi:MAG: NAD(P)/FAD-dependent oxidoreductase [Rheinheimera sp.]|nr:MAG: NAD(P)/FAD-dependent oxidoreductase [Rheinheimera sp.]
MDFDVVIIGAGPSGAAAGALLIDHGFSVVCLEKGYFPRFSIGESLLPHCMEFLSEAGLLDDVVSAAPELGFQFKNGAVFHKQGQRTEFDFTQKFTAGPGTTFQVKRATFDKILAEAAANKGVEIRYGVEVVGIDRADDLSTVHVRLADGEAQRYQCRFVLDASGFGRVLPRLFDLESPSGFPVRQACFCHIQDHIVDPTFDRNKILITVHPELIDVWFWLIPFSDGTASLGVVGETRRFTDFATDHDALWQNVWADPQLSHLLQNATPLNDVRSLVGYSANVRQLAGEGYALLGNAGEFLDPVFSSGVTIALRSACTAVPVLVRHLQGEEIDWEREYSQPLRAGIETFRQFVEAWYDGRFQKMIFSPERQPTITEMISSILAGYAWDTKNPLVAETRRRLNTLSELCDA